MSEILTITITKVASGETQTYTEEIADNDLEIQYYLWDEGNFSCDCNREAFFNKKKYGDEAANQPEPYCSDGRFTVEIRDSKGEMFYPEKEEEL